MDLLLPVVQLQLMYVSLLLSSSITAFPLYAIRYRNVESNIPLQLHDRNAHGRTSSGWCCDVANSNSNLISNATSNVNSNKNTDTRNNNASQWNAMYQEFLKYKNETGNSNVPLHHEILGNWVRTQRRMYYEQWKSEATRAAAATFEIEDTSSCHSLGTTTRTTTTDDRFTLLQSAGFVFDVKDHAWMTNFQELAAIFRNKDDDSNNNDDGEDDTYDNNHQDEYEDSHLRQRRRLPTVGKTLGMWVKNQRMQYKRGTLSKERIEMLNSIDFCWNPNEWQYRENVRQVQLESSKSIADWKLTDGPLGLWMSRQRTLYKKYCRGDSNHGLQPYQIQLLEEELGFDSSLLAAERPRPPDFVDWSDRMRQLEEFQRNHGHLNVPRTYTKHAKLGSWVAKVRERYRHYGPSSSKQIQERLQDLYDIGFIWDVLEYKWQQKFQQLIDFYELHGHVDVPDGLGGLGPWVKEQRREFNKIRLGEPSRLTPKHAMALNRIGLDWNRQRTVRKENQQIFMKRLQEWQDYSQHDGSQVLPSVHSIPAQPLRNWVERQRKLYRKWLQGDFDMSEERRRLLEDAGVVHGIVPHSVGAKELL